MTYNIYQLSNSGVLAKLKNIGRILLSKTAAPSETWLYTRAGWFSRKRNQPMKILLRFPMGWWDRSNLLGYSALVIYRILSYINYRFELLFVCRIDSYRQVCGCTWKTATPHTPWIIHATLRKTLTAYYYQNRCALSNVTRPGQGGFPPP